jgi:hypothetical protein
MGDKKYQSKAVKISLKGHIFKKHKNKTQDSLTMCDASLGFYYQFCDENLFYLWAKISLKILKT